MNPLSIGASGSVTRQRSWSLHLINLRPYGLAILSVGTALGTSLLLQHLHFRVPAAPLLLFAVAISSWYGGIGPAVLAVILSIISFYWYFVEPVRTIYIYRSEIPFFVVFAGFAALLSWFGTIRRRDEKALRDHAEALRASEAYLAEAQRLSHTGSWAWDRASDTYVYVSAEDLRIWGFDPQGGPPSREAVFRRIVPEDRDRVKESFQKSLHEKVDTSAEYRIVLPDGTTKHIHTIRHPILNDAGDVVRFVGTSMDISDRKSSEEALRRSEAYLTEAQTLTHTGTFVSDGKTRPLYWSEEMFRIFGFDPHEGIPIRETTVQRIHPEDRCRWKLNLEKTLREKVNTADELRIVLPDGTIKYVSLVRHPILDETGELVEVVGTIVDITERKRAEEALRRSEAYLAEGQRLTHTGSWASDCTGRPLYWSEEVFRIFGFDPQQGLPMPDEPLHRTHPEDLDKLLQTFDSAVHGKADIDVEFRIVLPDGTIKDVHGIGHPVLNANGEVVELVGTVIDITERKRADDALRRSEAYLNEAQRLSHTGSWALEAASWRYVYWSQEMFRIYGFDPQQGLPTREAAFRRLIPEDWNRVEANSQRSLREKVETVDEYRIVLPDGTVKDLRMTRRPVLNDAGDLVQLIGTTVDITEHKRAEETLRRTAAYLTETERLSHTGTWAVDPTTKPLYWSEEEFRIWGFDPLGGLPTRDQVLQRIPPEDRDRFWQAFQRSIDEKTDADVEFRILLPDGTVKYAYGQGHPVLNAHGELVELVGTTADITERKRAEEEREKLRQLEADLAHINRVSMLGELAASIAHEVNQPLSGVVSNASASLRFLAADTPDLEEVREAVCDIVRDGKRAGEVVARIRALTKRAAMTRGKLDLNETIREVLALVGDEARRNSVVVRTELADDLSAVAGDRVQLQQVVLNLVMNAIEAMSGLGERARELVITTRNIDAEHVQVTVEDSGIGLGPATIDKIFDSFYTTKPGGMGMGLSISRSILQAHGGQLWAVSKDTPGTAFHFTVPRYHEEVLHAGAKGT